MVTSYCALRRKESLCTLACGFCVSRKSGTGGVGWGHPQGAVHMAAARLGCKRAMVGTRLLLGLAKGPILYMNTPLRGLISGREGCLGYEQVFAIIVYFRVGINYPGGSISTITT